MPANPSMFVVTLAIPLWLALYGFAVWRIALVYRAWKGHVQFYITDFYAGIVGLLPTFIALRIMAINAVPEAVIALATGTNFLAQFLGMFYGRLDSHRMATAPLPGRKRQAFLIVTSGLIGFTGNVLLLILLGGVILEPCAGVIAIPLLFVPYLSNWLNTKK